MWGLKGRDKRFTCKHITVHKHMDQKPVRAQKKQTQEVERGSFVEAVVDSFGGNCTADLIFHPLSNTLDSSILKNCPITFVGPLVEFNQLVD